MNTDRQSLWTSLKVEPDMEYEKNVAETQKMSPDAPSYLVENVACNGQWNANRLPCNRRKGRALEKAKFLVLRLQPGDDEKTWKQLEPQSNSVEVIQAELQQGAGMRNNDLMAYREELARAGHIDQELAQPP